jgi:hypothetical protein
MSVIFVEHRDVASRDKARVKVLGENVDARTLTPNVRAAVERPAREGARPATTSSAATRSSSRAAPARSAVSGGMMLRRRPGAYLLAYRTEGVGESWAPMRDLWSRYV